ncbi:MAG: hypothetical protein CVU05_02600 [Bacteroidetes bacterium HGW-Bacteroidetes-21]|jgi:outer membrane protein|nr:MAG: hypothetical protein CVU05_02600 [Bacteroidetes bacterium HGW-Bacteroidetes-21]
MKVKQTLFILLIILCSCSSKDKNAYVELYTIYNDYDYTKEQKVKLTEIKGLGDTLKMKYENRIDSLYLVLENVNQNTRKSQLLLEIEQVKEAYNQKQNEFLQSFNLQVKQIDELIWKRINQNISEYGKANNYSYIFGAEGSGSIMYCDSTLNITSEVLLFINNKYQDVNNEK